MGIIDLTVEMERRKKDPYPCSDCEMGSASINQYTDPKTGHLMQESHDCTETCQIFKDYWNKKSAKEHLFGNNIRDAIETIKGK